MAAAASRDKIQEDTIRKSVNALLKWKKKAMKLHSQSDHQFSPEEDEEGDDFIYLSVTLRKVPPQDLSLIPHKIPLRHSLLSPDYSTLSICLIVDGKKITSEFANKMLQSQGIPFVKQVLKLPKLKSDYNSFDSKKKLYDSFDLFLAVKGVVPFLPKVLGKVFYRNKKKIPVPVELIGDGSNWTEEIERGCKSSLLFLSRGSCSAVRVGRLGLMEGEEIVENVFEAIDEVVKIVPRKWKGIRCLHLKFSDSVALPVYEWEPPLQPNESVKGGSGLVGTKRKRQDNGRKRTRRDRSLQMI